MSVSGDYLALHIMDHSKFERIMEGLLIRFKQLYKHRRIDPDRIHEHLLIQLLGWDSARKSMLELQSFPVLPFCPKDVGTHVIRCKRRSVGERLSVSSSAAAGSGGRIQGYT